MPSRKLTTWMLIAGLLACCQLPAQAAQRVALVIGNAAYEFAPRLANPLNDAADIAAAFGRLDFEVTEVENADYETLRQRLQEFRRKAAEAELAVVFYAGHGIEVDQRNYLVPVDARLASDQDVEFETVSLDLVMRSVARASGLRLIILDACRDNPFAVSMQRQGATRAIGRGLARVEPSGDTLVAYASKEGTVASDGDGRNSPFSAALLSHLEEPGLEVGFMFRKVRDAVLSSTGGRQEPFVYGSLSSEGVYLTARADPNPLSGREAMEAGRSPVERLAAEELAAELLFWETVKDSRDPADVQAYLDKYPRGEYVALARNRLKRLMSGTPPDVARLTPEASPVPGLETVEASLALERADRGLIQLGLAAQGFDPGPVDGMFGRSTRSAIGRWQASRGEALTGYLDPESARTLLEAGRARQAEIARLAREREETRIQSQAMKRVQGQAATPVEKRERQAGTVFRDCPHCPEMVVVPFGSFMMGSPRNDKWDADERPQHRVRIGTSFAVGVHEVTRGEFARFVEATRYSVSNACYVKNSNAGAGGRKWVERRGYTWRNPGFQQTDRHPVVCVSWDDARAYVEWLSRRTGHHYRLLSEAEWEYVARAGTQSARYWGEGTSQQCQHANGADAGTGLRDAVECSDGHARTSPVGQYDKNDFGLHDTLGNVWEWTQDCWHDEYHGAPADGRPWERGERGNCNFRVPRGGAWATRPESIRTAYRNRMPPHMRHSSFGFRVARTDP